MPSTMRRPTGVPVDVRCPAPTWLYGTTDRGVRRPCAPYGPLTSASQRASRAVTVAQLRAVPSASGFDAPGGEGLGQLAGAEPVGGVQVGDAPDDGHGVGAALGRRGLLARGDQGDGRPRPGGCGRTIACTRRGSGSSGYGFASATARRSAAVRATTGTSSAEPAGDDRPHPSGHDLDIAGGGVEHDVAALDVGAHRLQSVGVRASRRSAIGSLLWPPTLTPRSRATKRVTLRRSGPRPVGRSRWRASSTPMRGTARVLVDDGHVGEARVGEGGAHLLVAVQVLAMPLGERVLGGRRGEVEVGDAGAGDGVDVVADDEAVAVLLALDHGVLEEEGQREVGVDVEHQPAAGAQVRGDGDEAAPQVVEGEVVEAVERGDGGIEDPAHGQGRQRGLDQQDVGPEQGAGPGEHLGRRIDADEGVAAVGELGGQQPGAAAHVEDATRPPAGRRPTARRGSRPSRNSRGLRRVRRRPLRAVHRACCRPCGDP